MTPRYNVANVLFDYYSIRLYTHSGGSIRNRTLSRNMLLLTLRGGDGKKPTSDLFSVPAAENMPQKRCRIFNYELQKDKMERLS